MVALLVELWAWIGRDWKRFVWELALAAALAGISWALGYFLNNGTLQACQDERTVLLKQSRQYQAAMDQLKYEGQLAAKDQVINGKNEEILALKQKASSDSILHLSDLEAVRAINQYIQKGHAKK